MAFLLLFLALALIGFGVLIEYRAHKRRRALTEIVMLRREGLLSLYEAQRRVRNVRG